MAVDLGERSHWNKQLLIALANAVAANEETQRRFRTAVLIRLSSIEAMLTEVQGAQLADFWAPGRITDEQLDKNVREVQERVSKASNELGLKMVKYIYGGTEALVERPSKGRSWSDWEI
jgi:hypothetical protein